MSVNKVIKNSSEAVSEFLGARPIEENYTSNQDEIDKIFDDAGVSTKISENEDSEKIFISDNLALTTQYTRKIFKIISKGFKSFQASNAYT